MKNILITGANRGIGLELTRLSAEQGVHVYATYRTENSSAELFALAEQHQGIITTVQCDVASSASVKECFRQIALKTTWLDCMINNAGILMKGESHIELATEEALMDTFNTNVAGILRVTQAFLPLVRKGSYKKILNISSVMGSIERNMTGRSYSYRISKTAVNMFTKTLALELKPEGIVCLAAHPGWVRTTMGGENADISPTESATSLLKLLKNATIDEHSGNFYNFDGEKLVY